MYKLKSGKEINTNEKSESFIKKELDKNDSQPRILKAMIESGRPLRPYEIAELSKMSRERVRINLNIMVSKGIILIEEAISYKFYYPQLFFLDRDVLKILYGIFLPFIKEVNKNTDYSQLEINNREAVLENMQMLMKLFHLDINDIKNEI